MIFKPEFSPRVFTVQDCSSKSDVPCLLQFFFYRCMLVFQAVGGIVGGGGRVGEFSLELLLYV